MDPAISMRPLTEDDLPQVLEIEMRSHLAPWSEANFRGEMEKPYSQILVLTDDETDTQVYGYIAFWMLFDECQILNVVVDLPHRGLGHAQRMVRQVVQLALRKNLKRVILEVRKGNHPAIQLYQKIGFVITQVRKGFYSNGEDAYQMTLELSGPKLDF